ncbi:MAG TPA: LEPR-XLL domain-containing protein, partial [Phycisphaerae bacterium]|nr:LEPR-XLL domain-containing protein [Phycisphaerae bacterium]
MMMKGTPTGPVLRPLLESLERRLLLDGALIDTPISAPQEQALLDGMGGLANWANDLEGHGALGAVLPLVADSTGGFLDISDILQTRLVQPVSNYFATDATPTANELVARLKTLSATVGNLVVTVDPASVTGGLLDTPAPGEIQFNLVFQALRSATVNIDLGAEGDAHGLTLGAGATMDLTGDLTFGFTFGFDLAPGLPADEAFFLRVDDLSTSMDVHHDADRTFDLTAGFLAGQVIDGTVNLD